MLFGEVTKRENAELQDINFREKLALVPLLVMALVMGLAPMIFLRASDRAVDSVRALVEGSKILRVAK